MSQYVFYTERERERCQKRGYFCLLKSVYEGYKCLHIIHKSKMGNRKKLIADFNNFHPRM